MLANARSLVIGLIAGAFLGIFLPTLLQLPSPPAEGSIGSTISQVFDHMALSLRNSLQIAQRTLQRSGYKGARLPLLQRTVPTSTSISTSIRAFTSSPSQAFSTSSASMASTKTFLEAVKDRRSYYQLNKEAPISDEKIIDIVNTAVLNVPSSFNSQSARLVVLLGKEHDVFWDMVKETLKPVVPEEQWASHTEPRINGFKAGYGTILFLEDPEPVEALRKAFPIYAHHFGDWSEHTSAMHQFCLWVALEAEGFGANLQHYNPIIDRKVQEHYKIPLDWKLRAQLVFGGRAGEPGPKESKPLEERVFVHGAKN